MRLFWLIAALVLAGCGYKPASVYTRDVLGERIFTEVRVYLRDPENSVLIKDAVNEAVISRFKGRLSDKDHAQSELYISLRGVSFRPLQYDQNGYVIYYRAVTTLSIRYKKGDKVQSMNVSGNYDFPIEPNSVITDTKRFEAIKESSKKALDLFISKIAVAGYLKDNGT